MSWPVFDQEQIDAVTRVMRSGRVNYWTGVEARAFEQEFADYAGARFGIALANGTLALELGLKAVGIGPGDEVVVTPRSFIASVSAVVAVGARPVFADVDRVSQNLTVRTIEEVTTARTKAILVVHLAGWPCEMESICQFAKARQISVIEDCAQAHGAALGARKVGSFGEVAAFSFCQDKIMTTLGEGGMLLTSDPGVWERAWSFKDHGKSWSKMREPSPGPGFRLVHDSFGSNYRMTEVQAAVGRIQLRRLDDWLRQRRRNAEAWMEAIASTPGLSASAPSADVLHAWYKFYAFLDPGALREGWSRDRILEQLRDAGVPAFSGSCPEIYLESAFDSYPDARPLAPKPVARELGERSVMFLVDPTVTPALVEEWGAKVREVMESAAR